MGIIEAARTYKRPLTLALMTAFCAAALEGTLPLTLECMDIMTNHGGVNPTPEKMIPTGYYPFWKTQMPTGDLYCNATDVSFPLYAKVMGALTFVSGLLAYMDFRNARHRRFFHKVASDVRRALRGDDIPDDVKADKIVAVLEAAEKRHARLFPSRKLYDGDLAAPVEDALAYSSIMERIGVGKHLRQKRPDAISIHIANLIGKTAG